MITKYEYITAAKYRMYLNIPNITFDINKIIYYYR